MTTSSTASSTAAAAIPKAAPSNVAALNLLDTSGRNQNVKSPVVIMNAGPPRHLASTATASEFLENATHSSDYGPPTSTAVTDDLMVANPLEHNEIAGTTTIRLIREIEAICIEGTWSSLITTTHCRLEQYVLDSDKTANLCSYYRGDQVSHAATESFRELVSKPPHLCNPGEQKSIAQVLRDKTRAQGFIFFSIRTTCVNGRCVLIVEGMYEISQLHILTVYIDSSPDRDFAAIQELSLVAPRQSYYCHYRKMIKALQTIIWKP